MDPNATLARIRELTTPGNLLLDGPAEELAELIVDLDEWLSKGGFFPTEWSWNATTERRRMDA